MSIARVSERGQVVIPKPLRDKLHIKPHATVLFQEKDGQLILTVLPEDPVQAARGILKGEEPVSRLLARYREQERLKEQERSWSR